ncbi:Ovarian-specific serine/threonine-protein kinase Lok [Beauveria bassiana]|nr:Ovarian-specific serine/threonine-protein kinase Lok [Beauveria bassiana]
MHNLDFDDDDDDIILTLIPHEGQGYQDAERSTTLAENQRFLRHVPGRSISLRANLNEQDGTDTNDQSEREVTEPLPHSDTNCFVLRFSQGCKTTAGLVAGYSCENADLLLWRSVGIGKRHLAFTFDAMNVPIVRDLESISGIKVIYDGEQRDRLKNFHWSLVGPSIAKDNLPVLNIAEKIQFKVKVPKRDFSSPSYVEKVKRFRQGTAEPETLFASMDLPTTEGSTRIPTGQQSPLDGRIIKSIYVTRPLGEGSFGAVKYYWNVASRDEFVVKKPTPNMPFDRDMWKREAVALLEATFDPLPNLRLEYIPGGSLTSKDKLSEHQGAQVLSQLSSALDYLHTMNPPISHRDIKPENILVVERTVDNIYVKFGDFGLSKESEQLMTNCGTPVWSAPEIFRKNADPKGTRSETYTVAVDIWSLGVVVGNLLFGTLPSWQSAYSNDEKSWVRKFRKFFVDKNCVKHSKLLSLLLDKMIVMNAAERSSAGVIHCEVERILGQGLSSEVDDGESEGMATPMPRNMGGELTPRPGVNNDLLQVVKALNNGVDESHFFGSKDTSGETVPSDTQRQLAIDLREAYEAWNSCSPAAGSYKVTSTPEEPEMASIPRTHLDEETKQLSAANKATVIAHCDAGGKVQANGGEIEPIDGSRGENLSHKRKWPKDPSAGSRPVVEKQVAAAGKCSREHKRTKTDE